jgi:hypothetical protein
LGHQSAFVRAPATGDLSAPLEKGHFISFVIILTLVVEIDYKLDYKVMTLIHQCNTFNRCDRVLPPWALRRLLGLPWFHTTFKRNQASTKRENAKQKDCLFTRHKGQCRLKIYQLVFFAGPFM